jgi:hypothetical protein
VRQHVGLVLPTLVFKVFFYIQPCPLSLYF